MLVGLCSNGALILQNRLEFLCSFLGYVIIDPFVKRGQFESNLSHLGESHFNLSTTPLLPSDVHMCVCSLIC